MDEKKSSLEIGIEQMSAAIFDGDYSKVTVHKVHIKPAPQYSADEVKKIRHELNLTQRVLARVMSVSTRTVEGWEAGRSRPSRTASRLLEAIHKQPSIINVLIG